MSLYFIVCLHVAVLLLNEQKLHINLIKELILIFEYTWIKVV